MQSITTNEKYVANGLTTHITSVKGDTTFHGYFLENVASSEPVKTPSKCWNFRKPLMRRNSI